MPKSEKGRLERVEIRKWKPIYLANYIAERNWSLSLNTNCQKYWCTVEAITVKMHHNFIHMQQDYGTVTLLTAVDEGDALDILQLLAQIGPSDA